MTLRAVPVHPQVEELESRLAPSTVTVLADADAHVKKARPNRNFGAATVLVSDRTPQRQTTFLRFSLEGLTAAVQSAVVRVHVRDGTGNGPALHATDADWSESTISWRNRPASASGPLDDPARIGPGWFDFDVSSWVTGNGDFSFKLASQSGNGLKLDSRERAGFAPRLVVTPADEPADAVGERWSAPRQVGTLDTGLVDESSGLAVSRAWPDRLYHINDSGDGGYFYVSDLQGRNTRRVRVNGFNPVDAEDLAYGEVGGRHYLVIGDIGDNGKSRGSLTLVVIEEQADFGTSVNPAFQVTIRYPDGAHNAEALALHPSGDLYIMTKESPARVYRLRADQWQNAGGQPQTLQYVGSFNLAGQTGSSSITSLDISADGRRLLVLTYDGALELEARLSNGVLDFSQYTAGGGPAYRVIELAELPQQESISYLPNGLDFIYTSEEHVDEVPILQVDRIE